MANFVDNFNIEEDEQYSNEGVICPYCGYLHYPCDTDYYIYNDSLDTYKCHNCNKTFKMSLYISYSWYTKKLRDTENIGE